MTKRLTTCDGCNETKVCKVYRDSADVEILALCDKCREGTCDAE